MEQVSYRVGDIRRVIKESSLGFEPKLGANVKSDNKRNNEKSYKDAEKAAKDYDGGLKDEKKGNLPDKMDGNHTTLDYNPRTEVSKDFKDKVDAQLKGYTSKAEEKNGIEKAAEFDNDGKLKKHFTDASKEINKEKEILAHSGIQGANEPKKEKNTMYENKAKRLVFKHTKFLNESQMISRIPEEYKIDGQKIYMKDSADNEYVVECVKSEKSGLIETNIVGYSNKRLEEAQQNRIAELFGFEHDKLQAPTSMQTRVDESRNFQDIMNLAREVIK